MEDKEYTEQDYMSAGIKAHKAGDTKAAEYFASKIKDIRSQKEHADEPVKSYVKDTVKGVQDAGNEVKDAFIDKDNPIKSVVTAGPKIVAGASETVAAVGGKAIGDVLGAATSILSQDAAKGEKVSKFVDELTSPETKAGKAFTDVVSSIMKPVSDIAKAPVEALDKSGHPIASQISQATEDLIGMKIKAAGEIGKGIAKEAGKGYIKPANAVVDKIMDHPKVQEIMDSIPDEHKTLAKAGVKTAVKKIIGKTIAQVGAHTIGHAVAPVVGGLSAAYHVANKAPEIVKEANKNKGQLSILNVRGNKDEEE